MKRSKWQWSCVKVQHERRVNCLCSFEIYNIKKKHNFFYKEEAKDVSALGAMLLCKARIINSAAYVIVGQKWNIDCEGKESLGGGGQYKAKRQDKDSCYFLRPLYTNMERSAKATQCHTGLC